MLAKTKHFVRLISLFTTQNSSKRPNNPQFSHQNRRFCRQWNSGVLKNRFKSTYIPTTFLTSFSCPHEFIRKRPRGYIHLQSKKRCISIQYYYSTHLFSQFVDKNQIVHGQGGSRSKLQHHSQFIFDFFPAFITNLLFLINSSDAAFKNISCNIFRHSLVEESLYVGWNQERPLRKDVKYRSPIDWKKGT